MLSMLYVSFQIAIAIFFYLFRQRIDNRQFTLHEMDDKRTPACVQCITYQRKKMRYIPILN